MGREDREISLDYGSQSVYIERDGAWNQGEVCYLTDKDCDRGHSVVMVRGVL